MNAPPLLVSFSDTDSLIRALDPNVREAHQAEICSLVSRKLPPAVSIQVVACLFGVSGSLIGVMSRRPVRYYRTFTIRTGKKHRRINAPRVALKVIQKWLGTHIASAVDFGPAVFGFVRGRSAADAAHVHCGADWVYSVDIADFFPSVTPGQVCESLQEIGYSEASAQLVANLATLNEGLAQGSPASPVLSNLVFRRTDGLLGQLATECDSRFTRYADDIVFSGVGDFPSRMPDAVAGIVSQMGWKLAPSKVHLGIRPRRLKVHGLLVNGANVRLTKGYRNRIRAFKHLLNVQKIRGEQLQSVKGHLAYAASIDRLSRSATDSQDSAGE